MCLCLPVLWKTPGLQWQYLWAKASIILSIFWASPGKRKLHRNCLHKKGQGLSQVRENKFCNQGRVGLSVDGKVCLPKLARTRSRDFVLDSKTITIHTHTVYLRAWTRLRSVNSWRSTKAWRTLKLKSSLQSSNRTSMVTNSRYERKIRAEDILRPSTSLQGNLL